MTRTRFDEAHCPVARTADLMGDWWTPLVLRELLLGNQRFGGIQTSLEISRPILAERLRRLENEGVVERHKYQDNPPRYDYRLTPKGCGLWDVVAAMWRYGEDWLFEDAPVLELIDKRSGEPIRPQVVDATTGAALDLPSTRLRQRRRD